MIRYGVELRAALDGRRLVGHAAVFGQAARIRGGYEAVAPGAFDEALARGDDVRALVNHDPNRVLGRSGAGTLKLDVDDEGLVFEVDLPDTSYANDLAALVARGDVTGASFGFIPGKDAMTVAPDGRQIRTHTALGALLDVSVVTFPAYTGAGVALRSIDYRPAPSRRSQLIRARHVALYGRKHDC